MRCVEVMGSDDRMDCKGGMFEDPINALPIRCPACGFPDLDHVPQPYRLVRSRTMTPAELASAARGNLLVRDRVTQVLELVAPGDCDFHPTAYTAGPGTTPWWLAVPKHKVHNATVKPDIPRCPTCGEPRMAHPGTQYDTTVPDMRADHHLVKGAMWMSSESGWDQWLDEEVYVSIPLLNLLAKLGAKGVYPCNGTGKIDPPDAAESAWVSAMLDRARLAGIPAQPVGTLSAADAKWWRAYLKAHAGGDPVPAADVKAAERRLKLKLPKSYHQFITACGPATFADVDDEGITATILRPGELDATTYRAGALQSDDDTNAIDGIAFATTGHGDCYCFDVSPGGGAEYAVYVYRHEQNGFEPYAADLPACVRRFAGGR